MKILFILIFLLLSQLCFSQNIRDTINNSDSANTSFEKINKRSYYYENGNLKTEELYDKNKIPHGVWTEYYENGQLKIKQEFSNKVRLNSLIGMHGFGNITGEYIYYYKNGQLRFKLEFNNGKMVDGIFYEFYENGNKKQYGELKQGLRDGEWTELYENGDLRSKGTYYPGSYRACGRAAYIEYYEYKTGLWEYYYQGQKLMAKGVYENEIIDIKNGCSTVPVNCGALHKKWIFKDINGKKISLKEFKKSNLIENKEIIERRVFRPL